MPAEVRAPAELSRIATAAIGPANDRDLAGRTLKGTYRIVRGLAAGGMGVVYEAEHVRLHRKLAIKVLRSALSRDAHAVTRFRAEAETLASLAHPQIVQIFDADETPEGDLYLVMEYLEGETLADRLDRETRLATATALRITSRIASALAVVHEHGIVHRDLKPANVFLVPVAGDDAFVKLLDFGISRKSRGRRITAAHSLLGTPEYMPPEQVHSAASADRTADQFALAVMTYEMLTGQLPFEGETPDQVTEAVLGREPQPVSSLAPWVGHSLDAVIARALSKRADDRYPSISQFAWALENAARTDGIATQPSHPGPATRYSVWPQATEHTSQHVPDPDAGSGTPAQRHVERARRLLADALEARDTGAIDDAVFFGEKLLEVAGLHASDGMYALLASAISSLDGIFAARVGDDRATVVMGPVDPRRLNLSPQAAAVRSLTETGATVGQVVEASGLPRRHAVRILAGLVRRGALSVVSSG